jgi:hypothetical protein
MKAITRELVSKWQELYKEACAYEEQIISRIDYILKTWFKIYGYTLENWYFYGAEEGEVGDLYRNMYEYDDDDSTINNFYIDEASCGNDIDMIFIDKDNNKVCWENSIPTRWLYEDFEKEIRDGKKKYEDQLEAKKKAKQIRSEKKKASKKALKDLVLQSMKDKLSKKDIATIKRGL